MQDDPQFLDFLYIGTPRSGSTWLAACLNEHPDVFVPHNKEVHFFNDRHLSSCEFKYPRGIDYYHQFFSAAPPNVKLGELSPYYYYDPHAAARVAKNFPNVKIVAFLRNPVDMLFSLYLLLRQRERRAVSFEEEIEREPRWLDLACYHRLLTPWFDWFPADQIWISCYESIFLDPEREFSRICAYLDIDPAFRPKILNKRINASTGAKPNPIRQLRGDVIQMLNHPLGSPLRSLLSNLGVNSVSYDALASAEHEKPRLNPETRSQVMALLEPDLVRLEDFLGVDLNGWRVKDTTAARALASRPTPKEPALPRRPSISRKNARMLPSEPKKVTLPAVVSESASPNFTRRRDRIEASTPQVAPTLALLYEQRKQAKRAAKARELQPA